MFPPDVLALAAQALEAARQRGVFLFTAESCTGGLVSAALTAVPGASDVVLGAVVAYANEAKMELLRVPERLLARHGAVSEEAARAMCEGAILAGRHCLPEKAEIMAIAVTGVAGPGGGSAEKPVGTVHLATSHYPSGVTNHEECHFPGDREAVRLAAVRKALAILYAAATSES